MFYAVPTRMARPGPEARGKARSIGLPSDLVLPHRANHFFTLAVLMPGDHQEAVALGGDVLPLRERDVNGAETVVSGALAYEGDALRRLHTIFHEGTEAIVRLAKALLVLLTPSLPTTFVHNESPRGVTPKPAALV
jgi:hypothetical protein